MSVTTGISPVTLYVNDAAHEAARAGRAEGEPAGQSADRLFRKAAPSITSLDALLKNYKVLSLVLGAFNLQGSANDTAILRQVLTQNPASSSSLAQRLGNPHYQLFANALSNWHPSPFSTTAGINQLVSAYTTNQFEQSANQQAPGLANALEFTHEASSMKSVAAIQSDANLLAVAVTGLGPPLQNFEELSFDQQTSILQNKLHVADLQKPSYVQHLVETYLVQQPSVDSGEPSAGNTAPLFSGDTDTSGPRCSRATSIPAGPGCWRSSTRAPVPAT